MLKAQPLPERLWKLVYEHTAKGDVHGAERDALTENQKALRRDVHKTIAGVDDDIGRRQDRHRNCGNMELMDRDEPTDGERIAL
ncbi:hypothetical protein ACLK1S_04030 [Escherichia coli]